MKVRRTTALTLLLTAVAGIAGCTSGGGSSAPSASPSSSGAPETTTKSVQPSITRVLPPAQRQRLDTIPSDRLCDLVPAGDLGKLAFPVTAGSVADLGGQPPVRGCRYAQAGGPRSVLIGVQPMGYGQLGPVQVLLGSVRGTLTQHANDCTVLADVEGATLQVVVAGSGTESSQCDQAQGVAQYALAALAV